MQSVEEEAERIYKDEQGVLLDDEAASTRDAMWELVCFNFGLVWDLVLTWSCCAQVSFAYIYTFEESYLG